jgi:purine-binding chemotaxis protein CheW
MDFSVTPDSGSHPTTLTMAPPFDGSESVPAESVLPLPEKLALLKARALEMAKVPDTTEPSTLQLEVTEFRFGEEMYAFASTSIREVYAPKSITFVPCTPAFILGIINVRGRILPVIDIKPLFGQPSPPRRTVNKIIIIIHAEGMEVGLLADTIVGVRVLSTTAIHPPLPTLPASHSRYIRGITNDGTMILDAALLLTGSRLGSRV